MTVQTKWLRWDGRFDIKGICNRPLESGGKILIHEQPVCLDPQRRQEIPLVVENLQVRLSACEWIDTRLWIGLQIQGMNKVRGLLLRICHDDGGTGDGYVVYQEVVEGEVLGLLPDTPQTSAVNAEAPPQVIPLGCPSLAFKLQVWVSSDPGSFSTQRAGCRLPPIQRKGICVSNDVTPTTTITAASPPPEPRVITVTMPSPQVEFTEQYQRQAGPQGTAPVSAWDSPNPQLSEMVRRDGSSTENTVIQAMAEGHAWSAWKAPSPLAEVTAQYPNVLTQPTESIPSEPTEPAPPPTLPQPWPAPPPSLPTCSNRVPGEFQLSLVVQGSRSLPRLGIWANLLSPVSPTNNSQRGTIPAVLVRGIRGAITVDGRHNTELYNYDHPDNLFKAVAYLVRHHFGARLDPAVLRTQFQALLRGLFTSENLPTELRQQLQKAIPTAVVADHVDEQTRMNRYLDLAEADTFRGDKLTIALLGFWLGVEMQLYDETGEQEPLPLSPANAYYHRFRLLKRERSGSELRFSPLVESLPGLCDTSPVPYEISGAEVETFYRDATLSPYRRISVKGTLIQRVTGFYRTSDLRFITGDHL